MNQQALATSIMFRGMLDENPSLRREDRDDGPGRLIPPDRLELLRRRQAVAGLGCLTLRRAGVRPPGALEEPEPRDLDVLLAGLRQAFERAFQGCPPLFSQRAGLDELAFFFEFPESDGRNLERAFSALGRDLADMVRSAPDRALGWPEGFEVGYALVEGNQEESMDARAMRALRRAMRRGRSSLAPAGATEAATFAAILAGGRVEPVYQPIVHLASGRVIGWEAFLRGPVDSPFHDPLALLAFAGKVGEVFTLERLFWRLAIERLGPIEPDQKLFINIHPASFSDHKFTPRQMTSFLADNGLSPGNVVFEFTERQTASDLERILALLDAFRDRGILTAIDDVGAGVMTLRALCQIRPDYLKADVSIIGGIETNPFNRVLMETLAHFATRIQGVLVAVGVESRAELSTLASMGVQAGQGYLFSRPALPKPMPEIIPPDRTSLGAVRRDEIKCSTPVGDLAEDSLVVAPSQTIREVKALLDDKPPMSNVVVVDRERPLGLIMNYSLDRRLSTQFGLSLYSDKKVVKLMDRAPLMVEADTPLEEVAAAAMERDQRKIYDDIIVTAEGRFLGAVSVQKMLDRLARAHVEMAKGANPLTGLSGNVAIEAELERRAAAGEPSSLIYVDLDNFKVYNDVYGFKNGDQAILLASRVIREAVTGVGKAEDFIGHVGGDDFVIICEPGRAEDICREICRHFGERAGDLYHEEDRVRGYIVGKGRDGAEGRFPLVSMSLGYIDCAFEVPFSMDELSQRVAEVKKYAKSRPGNSYVKDRRAPLGSAGA